MKGQLPSEWHVQVGVAHDCIDYVLPFAYSARYHRVTGIAVGLTVGPPELTLAALQQGHLDFVITDRLPDKVRGLEQELAYDNPVFVVSSFDHPLAARAELVVADLVGQHWIAPSSTTKLRLFEIFQARNLPLPQVAVHVGPSSVHGQIASSPRLLGVHALPTILALADARAYLAVLRVRDLSWNQPVFAVYRGSTSLSPPARKLIDDLKGLAISGVNMA